MEKILVFTNFVIRLKRMKKFPRQYVSATLPHLPFMDNEFDLTLSAHFLFMYGDLLDYSFHLETLKELLRKR